MACLCADGKIQEREKSSRLGRRETRVKNSSENRAWAPEKSVGSTGVGRRELAAGARESPPLRSLLSKVVRREKAGEALGAREQGQGGLGEWEKDGTTGSRRAVSRAVGSAGWPPPLQPHAAAWGRGGSLAKS